MNKKNDIVKELKKRKRLKMLLNILRYVNYGGGITVVVAMILIALSSKLLLAFGLVHFLILCGGLEQVRIHLAERMHKDDQEFLETLSRNIEKKSGNKSYIASVDDLVIIPKNLHVGENLEASNAIPIFKEGHYVFMKEDLTPIVIRQYEDDDDLRMDVLDGDDALNAYKELTDKEWHKIEKTPIAKKLKLVPDSLDD